MTNEEVMQLMTEMGLHEGGIENWIMDNAWVLVVNKAIEKEREACAVICETYWNRPNNGMSTEEEVYGSVTAELIRARGQSNG